MIESELGEIPEKWKKAGLDTIAEFLNGLAMQKFPPRNNKSDLPVVKIRELKSGITEETDKANNEFDGKYLVDDGDVIFSWSGSLELVLWKFGKGALNEHLFKVTSNHFPKWFYYYWIKLHLPYFRSIAEGKATTMGHIQRHHLSQALVHSEINILNKSGFIISPIFNKLIINNSEIQKISKLRDTLLPKLMSGEINIKN